MEAITIMFIYMGFNQIFFIKLLVDIYTKENLQELKSISGILYSWSFTTGYALPIVSYIWIKKKLSNK